MFNWIKSLFSSEDLSPILERRPHLIDVRTPGEYRSGHGEGTENIPVKEVDAYIGQWQKESRPIIACCRSGTRSGMVVRKLKKKGLEAYNAGSWQNLNRIIQKADRS